MSNKFKILIIDDDTAILESLKLILLDHYNLILTQDSALAMEILGNDHTIALILLNIKMPQVNGLDLLNQIKEKYSDKKIIIVTGYKSVETPSVATELGADGYIVKPFDSKKILETVGKLINTD